MKVLTLKLGDKVYTTTRITAWMAREAMKISKDAIALARIGQTLNDTEITDELQIKTADEALGQVLDLMLRKVNLICKVYGDKFSVDELENELTNAEIDQHIADISSGLSEVIEKN